MSGYAVATQHVSLVKGVRAKQEVLQTYVCPIIEQQAADNV